MNHKIQKIMQDNGLTPSHFADQIDVQRSTISHILVGRNKPSLEIIQKIKRRFPEISYDWLIDEVESSDTFIQDATTASTNIHKSTKHTSDQMHSLNNKTTQSGVSSIESRHSEGNNKLGNKKTVFHAFNETNTSDLNPSIQKKAIEKILVFYNDGTFSEYLSK